MKIVQSNARIRALINKALAKEGNIVLKRVESSIRKQVVEVVRRSMVASPEINSLSGGTLSLDFGLTEDPAIDIINSVVASVRVSVSKIISSRGNFKGGIKITVQPSAFSNLLSLAVAKQAIEGGELPWLKWLLTSGDSIIIADFDVKYASGAGRTGGARMSKGGAFKVNPLFSGTVEDNFVTRAIAPNIKEISRIVRKELS